MIKRLVEFSLRHSAFVYLAIAILIGVGVWSAFHLPIDAVPDITNVQVQINTAVPALAPEEIEKLVTFPLETELAGIQDAVELRSLSKFGLSQVNIIFKDGTDVYRVRQLISERLQNVELPRGFQPKLAPIATGLGEIYYYTVNYKSSATNKPATRIEQLMELKQIQNWIIKPQLRSVPGIAEVNTSGGYDKQIVAFPNPQKLANAGITFEEFAERISENIENAGGGAIQVGGEQVMIRTLGRIQTIAEIENLPLKFRAGSIQMKVKDVAQVGLSSSIRTGAATENGEEALVSGAIMLMDENSRLVAERVREKLHEIQRKLPKGVIIKTVYDRTDLVNETILTVEKNLFEGAILVVVILFLMLGNWRAALIVASAIPLAMLFAITGMVQGRISGNLMSLGAIDFGLIIDGSVVMVENIVRRLGQRQHELGRQLHVKERFDAVLESAQQVANPMFFGVLIITLVYVPILVLTGIEGKMFRPMATTVIFALAGSLILALTLMPVLCFFILQGKINEEDNWLVSIFKKLYLPVLNFALKSRGIVLFVAVALFGLSLFVYSRLGAEFVPQLEEGSMTIQMVRATSIGLDASLELQKKAEKVLLKQFPEISFVFSRIGTSEIATDPMGVNLSDTYVFFNPKDQWRKVNGSTISKSELADLINKELSVAVVGQSYLFTQPIQMRFNEILEGTRADIAVKIFGNDYDELERIAKKASEIIEGIKGAADVEFDAIGKAPMLEIVPRREEMAKFNLHLQDVNKVVATALAGKEVGTIIDRNQRYEIAVRLDENYRSSVEAIKLLPVQTDDGGSVSIGQIADVTFVDRVNSIQRELGQRRVAILVNLRGRDVKSFVDEAQEKIRLGVKLRGGYYIEFGGQFKNLQQAVKRLRIVVPLTLVLILVLIFFSFESVRQAALIFTCVPLAITGGIFALAVRGLPFSISAGVGFIALSGIAVLNGIMLISFFNQLRLEGKTVRDSVFEGSLTRLRPLLMTALVASLGFVPMAIATGAGAEVQRPLATVVIGGIVSSTFLTLVLLPTLYEWIERRAENQTKGNTHHGKIYSNYVSGRSWLRKLFRPRG